MYYKVLIFLLFISFVCCENDIQCNQQSKDKMNDYIRKLAVFGDPDRNYPKKDEVQSHCLTDNLMITWGQKYTKKCLRNPNQETSYHVTNLLMFAMRKVSNKRCRTEFTRNILINAGKCANIAKADTQKCWKQFVIEAEKTNKGKKDSIKNDKHLIPLLCCSYHKFHDCCLDAWTKTNNAKPCNQQAVNELDSYLNDSMYETLQYLCGEYQENNDKCDNLFATYKDILNSIRVKNIPKSGWSANMDVFDSLPSV